jgi:integrase/recombinase XerC
MADWYNATLKWQKELQAAGRSAQTIRTWTHYVNGWARVCRTPEAANRDALIAYLACTRWEPETRKSARTALRSFYHWAHEHGGLADDPAATLPPVHVPPAQPRPAPEEAIQIALGRADKRQKLMVLLAAVYALRRGEISVVNLRDLDGCDLLVHGKGGRRRVVTLDRDLAEVIRGRCATAGFGGWLFPSGGPDGHYTAAHVGVLVRRVLPDGYTCHQLRHAAATALHEGGLDWGELSQFLGHSRVSTTQTYTRLIPKRTNAATTTLLRRYAR